MMKRHNGKKWSKVDEENKRAKGPTWFQNDSVTRRIEVSETQNEMRPNSLISPSLPISQIFFVSNF